MRIALDYDGTFTEDPDLWIHFIEKAQKNGHRVDIVTFREQDTPIHNEQAMLSMGVGVFYTAREAKRQYMDRLGLTISIWIDDNPDLIVSPSEWTDDQYRIWKEQEQKNGRHMVDK